MGCVALLYVPSIREELGNAIVAPLGVIGQRLGSGWIMMPRCGRLGRVLERKGRKAKKSESQKERRDEISWKGGASSCGSG
jgi:hypothetical protein